MPLQYNEREGSYESITMPEQVTKSPPMSADEIDKYTDGRLAGGEFLEGAEEIEDERPLTKVDTDMPLTHTMRLIVDGQMYTVLEFAPGDPENPYNWSKSRKWFISILLNLMTVFVGLATTAYSGGINSMVKQFGRSTELGQMGLFCFNMTCAILPLFLAPFCELAGRRVIYTGGYLLFSLCFIGLALGKNITTILVMRTLLGGFGCIGTILVGGTFDDMFVPQERTLPMASFAFAAILGTDAGPIYTGYIDEKIGWRWIEGIQGLANIPLLIIVALCLPETRGGPVLKARAEKLREVTGDQSYRAHEELEAPDIKAMVYCSSVKAFLLMKSEPVIILFGIWLSFAWFLTYLFLSAIPAVYTNTLGWSEGKSGLPYIALVLGTCLGFGLNLFQLRHYNQLREALGGKAPLPEARLHGSLFGGVMLPIGLFIFSFTWYTSLSLSWFGPIVGCVLIAIGIYFCFDATYNYTSDCYASNASSAIAGQSFLRNTLGAVSPLFGTQFFSALGTQWAGLILSIIALFLSLLPWVFLKYGPAIRSRSHNCVQYGNVEQRDEGGAPVGGGKEENSLQQKLNS